MLLNNTTRVALCGIVTALCTVVMLLTGISIGTYALPALAGVFLIVIVVELGTRWAFMVFGAVAVLSFLLAPEKEAALMFVIFFGYYPVLKAVLEKKVKKKPLCWLCKLAVFNVSMVVGFFLGIWLFHIKQEEFVLFGVYLPAVFLALGNLVFVVYDCAVSGLVIMYFQRFHKRVKKMLGTK